MIVFRQDIESFSHLSAKRLIELGQSGDNLEVKCNYYLNLLIFLLKMHNITSVFGLMGYFL